MHDSRIKENQNILKSLCGKCRTTISQTLNYAILEKRGADSDYQYETKVLSEDNRTLINKLIQKLRENDDYKTAIEQKEETMSAERSISEGKIEEKEKTINQLRIDLTRSKSTISKQETQIQVMTELSKTKYQQQMHELEVQNAQNLEKSTRDLYAENEELHRKLKRINIEKKRDLEDMKNSFGDQDETIKKGTLQREISKLQEKGREMLIQNKKLVEELETSRKENSELQRKESEILIQNRQLVKDLECKKAEIQKLQKRLQESKPSLVLGIRTVRSGMNQSTSRMITSELSRLLNRQFERENIDLKIISCKTTLDNPKGPLIVLCLNATRISSNIKEAMEGVKASKDVVLLIMHHVTPEHASSMYPTKHQIGTMWKELGGMFDIVFQEDSGCNVKMDLEERPHAVYAIAEHLFIDLYLQILTKNWII